MADPEHIEIVRQGAEAIAAWRRAHPDQRLDLGGADLGGADLGGANLRRAYLSGANLGGADLGGADLEVANLGGASLGGANLGGADLGGADLSGANLSRTDLRRADLGGAHLSGTNLSRANLEACVLWETVLADVDLRSVRGLEAVNHYGPSIVDFRTLVRSGPLPLPFLRGCGLPDRLIEYLPSLLNETIQYDSCFISYSTKDETFAKRLHADLQNAGVRCWFAPKDLKIGDRYREVFDRAIQLHDRTLLILSEHSVESEWVEKEVETAFEKERKQKRTALFPIRLDDAVMGVDRGWAADIRRSRHIGDFREWPSPEAYRRAVDLLLRDLQAPDRPVEASP